MSNPNSAPLLATMTVTAPAGGAGGATTLGTVLAQCLDAHTHLTLSASIVGSAGGTTDVYVQSRHGTADWIDLVHFPQVAGGGATVLYRVSLSRDGSVAAPVVVGIAGTPALAANTVVPGDFGDALRMVAVSAAGAAGGGISTCAVYARAYAPGSEP